MKTICSSCHLSPATIMVQFPVMQGPDRREPFCAACWRQACAMANTQYTARPIHAETRDFPILFDEESENG